MKKKIILLYSENGKKYLKIVKIAFGSALAIILANKLMLNHITSAGIITLLSIQDTKKETISIAMRRIAGFFVALFTAYFSFLIGGYNPLGFGIFLLLFIIFCEFLKLQDGISLNSVLITHFLIAKDINQELFWNEFFLLCIGVGIGMFLNIYIPSNTKQIKQDQAIIEAYLSSALKIMAVYMITQDKTEYNDFYLKILEEYIHSGLAKAYENMNNTFLSDTKYYIQYMEMRKSQNVVLKNIHSQIQKLNKVLPQSKVISEFLQHIANSLHESNNVIELLKEFENLKKLYRLESLPIEREEFKNRAILYQILDELECFLLLKREFVLELTENQIEIYWD